MALLPSLLLLGALIFSPQTVQALPQKGEQTPPFSIKATSGQQITSANHRGKVLLLQFFATWCSPCRNSMPHLERLNRQYSEKGLQVIGLSMDDDERTVREFLLSNPLQFPVALASEEMRSDYAIRSVPTLYVIDRQGFIVEKFNGFNSVTVKRLEKVLSGLISP